MLSGLVGTQYCSLFTDYTIAYQLVSIIMETAIDTRIAKGYNAQ